MLLHRRLFAKLLDTQPRRLAAPPSARRKRDNQDRDVARGGQTGRRAGREQPVQHVARNPAPPLPMTGTNRRLNRQPQHRPQGRGGEWPLDPAPAVQGGQLDSRRLTVAGACGPSLRKSRSSRRLSATFWGIPCFRWASRFAGFQR